MLKNIFRYPVLFAAVFGIIISITTFSLAYNYESSKAISHFNHDAMNRISVIRSNIEKNVLLMEAFQNFFHTDKDVTRDEFKTFSSYFVGTNDGLKTIEWIPIIKANELPYFIELSQKDKIFNFQIKERGSNGLIVSAGLRDTYYPTFYVEPFSINNNRLGFDHKVDSLRNTAITEMIKRDSITVTARLKEGNSNSTKYQLMLYLPIYDFKGDKKKLSGLIASLFDPGELIEGALESLQPLPIDITLLDQSAPVDKQLLYFHDSVSDKMKHIMSTLVDGDVYNPIFVGEAIRVGGRNWLLKCIPQQTYLDEYRTNMPWITLFVALCITLLIISLIRRNLEETDRVKELVEKRTYELNQMKKRFELAVEGADLALWDWNIETDQIYTNDRWSSMLGYNRGDIKSTLSGWKSLLHPDDAKVVSEKLRAHLDGHMKIYRAEYRVKAKDGNYKWILDTGKVFERNSDGRALRAIGIHLDITDSKEKEQLLEKISVTDHLTQIYNRVRLHEELNKEIERFIRYKIKFSLIMFDVDHFKKINDTYGHDVGDSVLIELAQVVNENIRSIDLFARWGGEEFIILATNIEETQANQFAEKLRLAIESHEFANVPNITCSFGVCEFKESYNNLLFLKKVDDALYKAKEAGRNCVRVEM